MTVPDLPPRPGSAPRIWGGIPPRNKNFTGRADLLDQLRRAATSKVTAVLPSKESLPQALQGLGGVGKTALAVEYAYRYQTDYDLVWWIPADQMTLVRSSLAALAVAMGLEAPSATGIDATTSAVLDALRRGEPFSRWLLIFDNADQPEDLYALLPAGPGDALITSRNHRWQSVVETVQLDVFERAESIQFLLKRISKGLTADDADRLSEKLGDLPLALVQAGAVLHEGGMAVDEYLQLLDERVTQILTEGMPSEYPTSMTAAWQISVSKLRQQLPQALELLRCCAFLGPEPIPRDVFRRAPEDSKTGVGELIADPILLARAIRELGRFALVRLDDRNNISVHRLIQALLRDELDQKEQAKYRYDAHSILAAGLPGAPTDIRLWPRYAALVAHLGSPVTDMARCQIPAHRNLALNVVRYLYVSGDFSSCELFAKRFIERWTEDSGPDNPFVLDAMRHRGNALRELGNFPESLRIIEETLNSAYRVLGVMDALTLALRNALGADLRASGDFTAARELDETTRAYHDEVFGPTDPQTLRVLNNLALDYELNSDFISARELHKRVYLLQRDALTGVSATEVLDSQVGLARAVRLCGDFAEARDLGEEARDFGRHQFGAEHYLTLSATIDLSIALRRIQAAHDEALELASEILELSENRLGKSHPITMAAAISLSNILRTIGQADRALTLATSAADRCRAIYGPHHPYSHGCMGNLALLHRLTKNPVEARRLSEAALSGLDARLTRDHFFSLTVAVNLASDMAILGDIAQAKELGKDSLPRLARLLGEDHPLTLGCAMNLVLDLRATGAGEEAEVLSAKTMSGYTRTLGADHPTSQAVAAGTRLDFDFDPPPI